MVVDTLLQICFQLLSDHFIMQIGSDKCVWLAEFPRRNQTLFWHYNYYYYLFWPWCDIGHVLVCLFYFTYLICVSYSVLTWCTYTPNQQWQGYCVVSLFCTLWIKIKDSISSCLFMDVLLVCPNQSRPCADLFYRNGNVMAHSMFCCIFLLLSLCIWWAYCLEIFGPKNVHLPWLWLLNMAWFGWQRHMLLAGGIERTE